MVAIIMYTTLASTFQEEPGFCQMPIITANIVHVFSVDEFLWSVQKTENKKPLSLWTYFYYDDNFCQISIPN